MIESAGSWHAWTNEKAVAIFLFCVTPYVFAHFLAPYVFAHFLAQHHHPVET